VELVGSTYRLSALTTASVTMFNAEAGQQREGVDQAHGVAGTGRMASGYVATAPDTRLCAAVRFTVALS
jgi:hypothetical protein